MLGRFFLIVLMHLMADDAAGRGTEHGMMMGDVTSNCADSGT